MLRWLLLPVSLVYGLVLWLRHWCFDIGLITSERLDAPVIVVGNLALGGTGKTPHTSMIIELLRPHLRPAILSRGYGRLTKGFRFVETQDEAISVGDETLQLKRSHPDVVVAVSENRVEGARRLFSEREVDVIVLDDAYQHRRLKPGLSVLLMPYRAAGRDYLLPVGRLRDLYSRHRKADIIVVSKCPVDLSSVQMAAYRRRFALAPEQIYFSSIRYSTPSAISGGQPPFEYGGSYILITGLAEADQLVGHVQSLGRMLYHFDLSDHKAYSTDDLLRLKEKFDSFDRSPDAILTTAKDAVKLAPLLEANDFKDLPVYTVPIRIELLADHDQFNRRILHYGTTGKDE